MQGRTARRHSPPPAARLLRGGGRRRGGAVGCAILRVYVGQAWAREAGPGLGVLAVLIRNSNKEKVYFTTINYCAGLIFNLDVQNQKSCNLQLSKPFGFQPYHCSRAVFPFFSLFLQL